MRVAIDAHMVGTQETGNETYVVNLVRALQRTNLQDVKIDLLQTTQSKSPLDPNLDSSAFRIVHMKPGNSVMRISWAIPNWVKHERTDVLHMTYNAPPWCPAKALVLSVHDLAYKLHPEFYSPRVRLLLSILVPLSIRRAKRVLTLSENSKRDIAREYRVPEHKIIVTPAAAPPDFCIERDATRLKSVREKYGLVDAFILAVGNLEPRKNLLRLVRVYGELRGANQIKEQLVIVGQDHWQGSVLEREVKHLGLANQVVFTKYIPMRDLIMLYNAARAFVYPSLYEGFGLPILEAMACGTPVIASNVASIPEVAGNAALLINPLSDRDLAQTLVRLLTDDLLRHKLQEKGLAQATHFSWEQTAHLTVKTYQDALAS